MKIRVTNMQKAFRVEAPAVRSLARALMAFVGRLTPRTKWSEVDILLTDNTGITAANLRCFGSNSVTDVISLRYDPMPLDRGRASAEIIVNVQRAVEYASRRSSKGRWSASRELALYIAHGLDHLTGADDSAPKSRASMRNRELRWLRLDRVAVATGSLIREKAGKPC